VHDDDDDDDDLIVRNNVEIGQFKHVKSKLVKKDWK